MLNLDTLMAMVIGGFSAGFGSTIGGYLANRGLIKNIEKIEKLRK